MAYVRVNVYLEIWYCCKEYVRDLLKFWEVFMLEKYNYPSQFKHKHKQYDILIFVRCSSTEVLK